MGVKIALLGGSFNPLHIGHLALADEVLHQLDYDKVIFVPARRNPLKETAFGADEDARLEMLRAAVLENAHFEVDSCEMMREGMSYTFDTILQLEQKLRGVLTGKLGLIIGDDLLSGFKQWYKWRELAEMTDIIVARRLEHRVDHRLDHKMEQSFAADDSFPYRELQNALFPISSSDIRARISSGLAWQYLVPKSVSEYIKCNELYGLAADNDSN